MQIKNRVTGEILQIDRKKARLRRCQKRVKAWAEVIQPVQAAKSTRMVMLTLTYAEIDDWGVNHIRDFMLTVRKNLGAALLAYSWVAELQQRGAVHYHVLLLVEKGTNIPKPDDAGWWVHGLTRIETAKSPFYVLKYTGKEYQKMGHFPKGLRMFAVWISPGLVPGVTRWFFRLSTLPAWLLECMKGIETVGQKFCRKPGGGWFVGDRVFKSPWVVVGFS